MIYLYIMVYDRHYPPIEYVRKRFKISEKQYELFENILWEYAYRNKNDAIEDAKGYIAKNKMSLNYTKNIWMDSLN